MTLRANGFRRLLWFGCLLGLLPAAAPMAADELPQDGGDYPFIAAAYTVLPAADLESDGRGGELQTKETRMAAGLLQFGPGSLEFDLGIDYQYSRYTYENVDGRNRDLHRLQVPLGFKHHSDDWGIDGFLAPGVATSSNVMKDFIDRGSSDDLVITAKVEGQFLFRQGLDWLAGIAYDRAFGEPRPYPVFGLLYRPGPQLALRLAIPDPALRYRISGRHQLSVRLFPAGFEWHVFSDELNDDFDYEVEAIRLQAVWSYRFAGSALLDLSLGYEFDRRHRFTDDTGRVIDSDVGSQVLLAIGLRWGNGPIPYTHEVARQ